MLRPTSTNISVITNFGCQANCWYCIWKGHPLESVNEPTDWKKLEKFLAKYQSKGKVSVSGGGDSLYLFNKHKNWWKIFLAITKKLNLLVDVHTRKKLINNDFWLNINRCVWSSDNLSVKDQKYLHYLSKFTKIRITHLITKNTTNTLIKKYLMFASLIKCQFTIKELVKFNDGGKYIKFRKKYPGIFYLDSGDYNIYYMPDNSIKSSFL